MTHVPENSLFSLLPDTRLPWTQVLLSFSTQSLAVFALVWVAVLHLQVLPRPENHYRFIPFLTTPPVSQKPAPLRVFKPAMVIESRPDALHLPRQVRHEKQTDDLPAAPKVALASTKPEVLPASKPVIPRQLVRTNVFSTGSSATPTMAAAPQKVQTGGFGDPNGIPARENHGKPVNIAQLGSFDLPSGAGYGNGTAGANGTRGVVASAGFGSGTAIGDGSGTANTTRGNVAVKQAGFGDVAAVAAAPARTRSLENAASRAVSAEIVAKPSPVYTEEARKLRIEGEVLLQVVFESSGKVRIVKIVRGLGHGLDEAAIKAAEQIRFRPAQQDGQPVDFSAVLHILFQLA